LILNAASRTCLEAWSASGRGREMMAMSVKKADHA
jgi:hypothetical protein